MTIRFSVEKVFDSSDRAGLLAAGWILGGEIETGMTLGDGTGAQTTVLGVEFESPADRRTGQTTLLVERTAPSPVTQGTVLTVEERLTPPVKYAYRAIYATADRTPPASNMMCYEVTIGTPRTLFYNAKTTTWEFDRRAGSIILYDEDVRERTMRIPRTEAERIAREELGISLPPETEWRPMMLAGEMEANRTPGA